jgi:hypothetical protein
MRKARGTKSIIDYIVIIEKLRIATRDTSVFRLSDINTELCMLQSKFKMHTQYYIEERNIRSTKRNGTLKIHFWEEKAFKPYMKIG